VVVFCGVIWYGYFLLCLELCANWIWGVLWTKRKASHAVTEAHVLDGIYIILPRTVVAIDKRLYLLFQDQLLSSWVRHFTLCLEGGSSYVRAVLSADYSRLDSFRVANSVCVLCLRYTGLLAVVSLGLVGRYNVSQPSNQPTNQSSSWDAKRKSTSLGLYSHSSVNRIAGPCNRHPKL
jgi:hypothetical protein